MESPQPVFAPPPLTPPSAPTKRNMNTAAVWWVVALAIIIGAAGAYFYTQNTARNKGMTQGPIATSRIIQGTVTGVDADKLQITITSVATTSVQKVVAISPATKIEKVISQKNANGTVEKQAVVEVNIGDVQKGNTVTVVYSSDTNNVLDGVSQITFVVEGNIDAYFKAQAANQTPFVKGEVVAVDSAGETLQYKPYFFTVLTTTAMSVDIPDGVSIYRIDDPARISITHARTPATLADIQPGQVIFMMTDAASLKVNKVVPQEIIISAK